MAIFQLIVMDEFVLIWFVQVLMTCILYIYCHTETFRCFSVWQHSVSASNK